MRTRKILKLWTALWLFFGLTAVSHATLIPNGDGTVTDDTTNLMWLQDANLAGTTMNWYDAMAWADGLSYAGYDDWRLPTTPGTGDGLINEGEMGNLYYTALGNPPSGPLTNTGPFTHLQSYGYWSGTDYAPYTDVAWVFYFSNGNQIGGMKFSPFYAWAVRPGESVVPEPGTLFLLGTGLSGMALLRKRARRLHG